MKGLPFKTDFSESLEVLNKSSFLWEKPLASGRTVKLLFPLNATSAALDISYRLCCDSPYLNARNACST